LPGKHARQAAIPSATIKNRPRAVCGKGEAEAPEADATEAVKKVVYKA